ncbi:hypothetical protein E2C01_097260 [Portunus trituberculatus]|uniref:Uncharacterized protein n=1 Tax=Portunus trituberculatus TaxID=210409 RepID=A0A5B7K417_PORTR|nr:hypothetical protein [Portunus trituberculatus]
MNYPWEAKSVSEAALAVAEATVAGLAAVVEAVETAWSKQGRGKGASACSERQSLRACPPPA